MTARSYFVRIMICAALWFASGWMIGRAIDALPISPAPRDSSNEESPVQPRCEEDMPCWDCTTMGNRICGPATDIACDDFEVKGVVICVNGRTGEISQ